MKSIAIFLTVVGCILWGCLFYLEGVDRKGNTLSATNVTVEGFALTQSFLLIEDDARVRNVAESNIQTKQDSESLGNSKSFAQKRARKDADCISWRNISFDMFLKIRPTLLQTGWDTRVHLLPDADDVYVAWSGPYQNQTSATKALKTIEKFGCQGIDIFFVEDEGWGVRLGVFEKHEDATAWLHDSTKRCRIENPAVRRITSSPDAVQMVFRPISSAENVQLRRLLEKLIGPPMACPKQE